MFILFSKSIFIKLQPPVYVDLAQALFIGGFLEPIGQCTLACPTLKLNLKRAPCQALLFANRRLPKMFQKFEILLRIRFFDGFSCRDRYQPSTDEKEKKNSRRFWPKSKVDLTSRPIWAFVTRLCSKIITTNLVFVLNKTPVFIALG